MSKYCKICGSYSSDDATKCNYCGRTFTEEVKMGINKQTTVDTQRLRNFAIGSLICTVLMLIFAYMPVYSIGNTDFTYGIFSIADSHIDELEGLGSVMSFMLVVGTILTPIGILAFIANPEPEKKWTWYVTAIGEVLVILSVLMPIIIAFSFAMSATAGGGSFSDAFELVGCNLTGTGWLVLVCYLASALLFMPISKEIRKNKR